MGIWYFADRSVKYTWTPFRNSGTTIAFDLKFSPVIDIDHVRQCAKSQLGHLRGWYFTDRGQYFTQNAYFLHNHLADFAEILTANLYYQYLPLVKISSQ